MSEGTSVNESAVTYQDVETLLAVYDGANETRYQALAAAIDNVGQAADASVSGTVLVDGEQWAAVRSDLATLSEQLSIVMYLVLLAVCVVGAILGAHLWRTMADGWRH